MFLQILLLFTWFTSYVPLMITSNGSPQDYGNFSNLNFTFDECVEYCNEEERCMVIYEFGSTVCQVFEIGEVKSVKRNSDIGKRFGYKIADSENSTCPAERDTVGGERHSVGNNRTTGRQIYQSYSISYDSISETWIFNASIFKMCPNHSFKMFLRAAGPWCIVFMRSQTPTNNSNAAAICSRGLVKGVLTGLDTPEEFDFIKECVDFGVNDTMKPTFGTWLGGVRKPECIENSNCQGIKAFSFSDPTLSENPTGYLWNPNQPDGNSNDCLSWITNPDGSYGVSDFPCTITQSSDGLTYFYGYMCGRHPAKYPGF